MSTCTSAFPLDDTKSSSRSLSLMRHRSRVSNIVLALSADVMWRHILSECRFRQFIRAYVAIHPSDGTSSLTALYLWTTLSLSATSKSAGERLSSPEGLVI